MLDISLLLLRIVLIVFVVVATLRLYTVRVSTDILPDEDAQLVVFGLAIFGCGVGIGFAIAAVGVLGP